MKKWQQDNIMKCQYHNILQVGNIAIKLEQVLNIGSYWLESISRPFIPLAFLVWTKSFWNAFKPQTLHLNVVIEAILAFITHILFHYYLPASEQTFFVAVHKNIAMVDTGI
jgi:hypothetical protein